METHVSIVLCHQWNPARDSGFGIGNGGKRGGGMDASLDSCGLPEEETYVSPGLSSMVGGHQWIPAGHGVFGDGNGVE